jgi:putative DNA primase/helicase
MASIHELIERWPASQPSVNPTPSDLAEIYLAEKKYLTPSNRRLVHWHGDYYLFAETHYSRLPLDVLRADLVSWLQNSDELKKYSKTNPVNNILLNIEARAKLGNEITQPSWLDGRLTTSSFVTLKNGVFDLGEFLNHSPDVMTPHSPNFFATTCLPYNYDPNAKCSQWTEFIEKMQPDEAVRNLIQEWFGYNLIFDTVYEKFLLFVGEGANGKTVFCVVLRTLLGETNVSAVGLEAFSATRTFPLAATVGKLANIVEELNEVDRTAEGELKKFVSGGLMTVERKHRDPFEFRPSARLTFATNVLPKFVDRSDGLWRRMLLIPCTVQIKNEREQNKRLIDPKYWEVLGELPGIFNWALDGLMRLRAHGHFTEAQICTDAKTAFKRDANPAKLFLQDQCEFKTGAQVSGRKLYQEYVDFVQAHGHFKLSEPMFSQEVKRVFPKAEKSPNAVRMDGGARGRVWYHIDLLSPFSDGTDGTDGRGF